MMAMGVSALLMMVGKKQAANFIAPYDEEQRLRPASIRACRARPGEAQWWRETDRVKRNAGSVRRGLLINVLPTALPTA